MSLELRTRLHRSVGFYLEEENARLASLQRGAPRGSAGGHGAHHGGHHRSGAASSGAPTRSNSLAVPAPSSIAEGGSPYHRQERAEGASGASGRGVGAAAVGAATTDAALGNHFARGGVPGRALLYYLRALQAALREGLLAEAVALGEAASEIVHGLPQFAHLRRRGSHSSSSSSSAGGSIAGGGEAQGPGKEGGRPSFWARLCGGGSRAAAGAGGAGGAAPLATARSVAGGGGGGGAESDAASALGRTHSLATAPSGRTEAGERAAAQARTAPGPAQLRYGRAAAAYRRSVSVLGVVLPARGLALSLALRRGLLAESWRLWRTGSLARASQPALPPPSLNVPTPEPRPGHPGSSAYFRPPAEQAVSAAADETPARSGVLSFTAESEATVPSLPAIVTNPSLLALGGPPPSHARVGSRDPSIVGVVAARSSSAGAAPPPVPVPQPPGPALGEGTVAVLALLGLSEVALLLSDVPLANLAALAAVNAHLAAPPAAPAAPPAPAPASGPAPGRRTEEHAAFVERRLDEGAAARPARCALALAASYHLEGGEEGDATLVVGLETYGAVATVTGLLEPNCLEATLGSFAEALAGLRARHGETAAPSTSPSRPASPCCCCGARRRRPARCWTRRSRTTRRRWTGRAGDAPAAGLGGGRGAAAAAGDEPAPLDPQANFHGEDSHASDAVIQMLAGPAARASLEAGDAERALELVEEGLRLLETRESLPDYALFHVRDLAHAALALAEAGDSGSLRRPVPGPDLVRRALAALEKAARARHGCAMDAAMLRVCLASLEPRGGPRREPPLAAACAALERVGLVAPAAWARRVQAGAPAFGAPEGLAGAASEGPDSRSVDGPAP
eukprot:tig00001000_g6178.t1